MQQELKRNVEDLDTEGMDGRWFSEAKTEEDRASTRQMLLNSQIQWRLLKAIVRKIFNEKQLKQSDFDKPNFDQKRLYDEGYLKALQDIYKIIP
jgi:hypothetical protein